MRALKWVIEHDRRGEMTMAAMSKAVQSVDCFALIPAPSPASGRRARDELPIVQEGQIKAKKVTAVVILGIREKGAR